MDRYATYSGSDPRKAPAVLSTIAFIEEAFGAWHIKGGIGTLSEHIAARCEKVGVALHLNSPVAAINMKRNKVIGLTLSSGDVVSADIVISNADAGFTYNKLISTPTRRVKKVRHELSKLEPSLAGFSLLLGLRPSEQSKLSHHTILFPDDYDAEFEAIFTAKKPVEEPTIYICSPHDPTMVKSEGHEALFILVNAPGGSIYGTSSNGPRAAFLRAKNRSPLKNLYLVGGSSHPGGGLPLVGLSAEIVANAILASSK